MDFKAMSVDIIMENVNRKIIMVIKYINQSIKQ